MTPTAKDGGKSVKIKDQKITLDLKSYDLAKICQLKLDESAEIKRKDENIPVLSISKGQDIMTWKLSEPNKKDIVVDIERHEWFIVRTLFEYSIPRLHGFQYT